MGSKFAQPKRKSFDTTPISALIFASANVIELAGYHTPEMPGNVKMTKEWYTNDIHQSKWYLEALRDPDPKLTDKFNGASPIEYKLHCRTIGARACYIYRSDQEWLGKFDEKGINRHLNNDMQAAQIPYFIEGLSGFPKDIAVAEYPILETWHVPNHSHSGVGFTNNMFGAIIANSYPQLPGKNNASQTVKKGITSSLRNWYSNSR